MGITVFSEQRTAVPEKLEGNKEVDWKKTNTKHHEIILSERSVYILTQHSSSGQVEGKS